MSAVTNSNLLSDLFVSQYALFESNDGDADIRQAVSDVIVASLNVDVDTYAEQLRNWVDDNKSRLEILYGEYGNSSAMAQNETYILDYFIWIQPESIGILEGLDSRPWAMRDAWMNAGLPERWFSPLASVGTNVAFD